MINNEIKRLKAKIKLLENEDLPIKQLLFEFVQFSNEYGTLESLDGILRDFKIEYLERLKELMPEDKVQNKMF